MPSGRVAKLTVSPLFILGQSDEFAGERLADEDQADPPLDLARRPDAPHLVAGVIPGLDHRSGLAPGRVQPEAGGRVLAQGLMRALLVVFCLKASKRRCWSC